MEKLRVGSFFSGIGAFEKALERLEIPHRTVFYCEIDKYASKSYSLIHNVPESLNLWDITKVNEQELPDFDLMTWGFPCTDISVAGKQEGFINVDGNKTRSGLYYDGLRILKHKMPKYSIIENVKNLTSEKFRPIFNQILCDLEDAGYHSYYEVLNAKDYGIPQNRERVFIVSIRKDIDQGFMFPQPFDNGLRLKDLLEDEVDEKYYISQEKTELLLDSLKDKEISNSIRVSGRSSFDKHQWDLVTVPVTGIYKNNEGFKPTEFACTIDANCFKGLGCNQARNAIAVPVLTPDRQEKRQNGRRFKDDGEPMFSLTTQDRHGILIDTQGRLDKKPVLRNDCPTLRSERSGLKVLQNYRIRKLTPLECFRLMGFDDADYHKCKTAGISDSQLYKIAGNSIVCQVLEGILNNLFLKSDVEMSDFCFAEQLALFG